MFQETHYSLNDEKQWKDEFNGPLFFSHSKTNSCGVATGLCEKNSFDLIDQNSDENGRILITEAKINEDNFIVIIIYNSNTEYFFHSKKTRLFFRFKYTSRFFQEN